jgi:hypothetical protein
MWEEPSRGNQGGTVTSRARWQFRSVRLRSPPGVWNDAWSWIVLVRTLVRPEKWEEKRRSQQEAEDGVAFLFGPHGSAIMMMVPNE